MKSFRAPAEVLGRLDPATTSAVIAAAADLVLVIDAEGIVRDLALGRDDLAREGVGEWIGRPFAATVTPESRPTLEALCHEARAAGNEPRWRQVSHPVPGGIDLPVLYTVLAVDDARRLIALGRDLRSIAALEQRLLAAQQTLERDYARLRGLETRYRLLFKQAAEGILIVDSASAKVLEANPAAHAMLGDDGRPLAGRAFPFGFEPPSMPGLEGLLASARELGAAGEVRARLGHERGEVSAAAALFRQEHGPCLLIRLAPLGAGAGLAALPRLGGLAVQALESMPDGFVLTDPAGRILSANQAFLTMVEISTEDQVRGDSLGRFLGRPGVDIGVLLGTLRQRPRLPHLTSTLATEAGGTRDVDIAAVALEAADPPCLAFAIRDITRRPRSTPRPASPTPTRTIVAALTAEENDPSGSGLNRAVAHLAEQVGQVPLRDIIRDTTDLIERMCIQAALEMTGNNRASAAEMLGLSRQSLYVKLRRFGLSEAEGEE
ncbi:transcriptional regulator PpsR [Roseospirillum parvum]|uniref:Transcriptional regulator PpsR n=1 Tax=Roseospirillum parvum TaxID=83401 RepID=A0A1G7WCZ2_9PROT|nr:transcriptional regulator PpsR [Roseospirillum parvum]SDG69798.1 transcriptional regulator PpsR [Roseospirillum parvum]